LPELLEQCRHDDVPLGCIPCRATRGAYGTGARSAQEGRGVQVAITGASGFLGTAIGRALPAAGHTVRPLVRRPTADPAATRWDPAAGPLDPGALAGVDAVVHLAGAGIGDKRWSARRKQEILESRTTGTALVARTLAAMPEPPRVLVCASGIGYYGDGGDAVLTAESPPGDDFVARVVVAWEEAARPAVEAGVRTVFLRTAPVLAGHGGLLPRMALPSPFFVAGRLGSGPQWISWVGLVVAVRACPCRLGTDLAGPVNPTRAGPVTNAGMAAGIGRALRRPAAVPVPAALHRLLLGREMADLLLFVSQRAHPAALEAAGFSFRHPDVDAAR